MIVTLKKAGEHFDELRKDLMMRYTFIFFISFSIVERRETECGLRSYAEDFNHSKEAAEYLVTEVLQDEPETTSSE